MKKVLFFVVALMCNVTFSFGQSGIITTIAGTGIYSVTGDGGPATAATLQFPQPLAVDGAGNIYIGDGSGFRIRKIDPSGIISTIVGNGVPTISGDGGPATAATIANAGVGLAVDNLGNIFISDDHRIRKIDASGIITTVAGGGTLTSEGVPATAADIYPGGVVVDGSGSIYFCDGFRARVRKVDPSGIVTTIAGDGTRGFSGDGGPATSARLDQPDVLTMDPAGNIYIWDQHNYRIRKVDISGIITTIAGNGTSGFSGDGGVATAASFTYAYGLCADAAGNVYMSDVNNHRVRKIDNSGVITTVTGTGTPGYSGDGGFASSAEINVPWGVALDALGNVYMSDQHNHVVRKVTYPSLSSPLAVRSEILVYPNPAKEELLITGLTQNTGYRLLNVAGVAVQRGQVKVGSATLSLRSLPAGIYILELTNSEGVRENVRVVKE